MPHIAAFRALRYDPGHVGSLQGVIAPTRPANHQVTNELYQQHPANAIRLIQNRDEPGDDDSAPHERAGRFFRNWQREGVLQREPDPAIYAYHQQFIDEGRTMVRRGFICRTRIDDIDAAAADDSTATAAAHMTKSISQCHANVSPIVCIYDGVSNEPQQILEDAILGLAPIEATDAEGVLHRFWPLTDIHLINQVISAISYRSTFATEGLHAYHAAQMYRSSLGPNLDQHDAAQYVMTVCFHMHDPGLVPAANHRLFAGITPLNADTLKTCLEQHFDVRIAGEGSDLAEMIFDQIRIEEEASSIGLYSPADERWLIAKLNDQGRKAMDDSAPDQSLPWRYAGPNILNRLVMQALPQVAEPEHCRFIHHTDRLIELLNQQRDVSDRDYSLAAITLPTTMELVRELSERHEIVAAENLMMYPPSYSGLMFNPHEA